MKLLHQSSLNGFALIGFLIAGGALANAADNVNQSNAQVPDAPSIRDLNRHADRFAGHEVVVDGKVSRIEGPDQFIAEGSGLFNNKILVIVAKNEGAKNEQGGALPGQQPGVAAPTIKEKEKLQLREKEKLQLRGKVEQVGVTKIENTYSISLKPEIKAEFEGVMPVLVVQPGGIKAMG